jgi:hypothetical protein
MAQSLEHKTDRTSTRTFRMAKSQAKRQASFAKEAETTAKKGRDIQREIDRSDKRRKGGKEKGGAMQAGARLYPVPPLPGQHVQKPGEEAELELQPVEAACLLCLTFQTSICSATASASSTSIPR